MGVIQLIETYVMLKAKIIWKLIVYLIKYPNMRFGQALFNLHINVFENEAIPENADYHLKDIYNDSDQEILNRIMYEKKND